MGIPASEKKLLEEIEFLKETYFVFDKPVSVGDFTLFPVTVRDYNDFMRCSSCFLLNKNDDPDGITQTHLGYLLNKMTDVKEGAAWCWRFSRLCELIFRIQDGLKCPQCGKRLTYAEYLSGLQKASQQGDKNSLEQVTKCECGGVFEGVIRYERPNGEKPYFIIDGKKLTSKDYDKIRKIAMYQNLINFKDDSWVHPAVRADEAARRELEYKSNPVEASLERKITCVVAKSNYKFEEVYDLPIRKFTYLLEIINDAMSYETERVGRMSGMVKFEKPIEHWIYRKKETDIYGEAVSLQTWTNGIQESR